MMGGSKTPEETAISISGEFIAAQWGGTENPLSVTSWPIHCSDVESNVFEAQPRASDRVARRDSPSTARRLVRCEILHRTRS